MSIESVKDQHEEHLMQLPNVTGVGIGEKGGKQVIKVFVTHKVPAADLRADEIIPQMIEEYQVDVEESGTITAQPG
jgi:hypothetical protein